MQLALRRSFSDTPLDAFKTKVIEWVSAQLRAGAAEEEATPIEVDLKWAEIMAVSVFARR
jgi:hypothetical protein